MTVSIVMLFVSHDVCRISVIVYRFFCANNFRYSPSRDSIMSEFGSPLKRFKLVFLGEQSGELERLRFNACYVELTNSSHYLPLNA